MPRKQEEPDAPPKFSQDTARRYGRTLAALLHESEPLSEIAFVEAYAQDPGRAEALAMMLLDRAQAAEEHGHRPTDRPTDSTRQKAQEAHP